MTPRCMICKGKILSCILTHLLLTPPIYIKNSFLLVSVHYDELLQLMFIMNFAVNNKCANEQDEALQRRFISLAA